MADSASKKMSNIVVEDELDSDDSDNILKYTTSDVGVQSRSNCQSQTSMLERSKCFLFIKSVFQTIIMALILIYFLVLYYLEKENAQDYVLVPCLIAEVIILLLMVIPRCFIKGMHGFFNKPTAVLETLLLIVQVSLDAYEISSKVDDRIEILIGVAR